MMEKGDEEGSLQKLPCTGEDVEVSQRTAMHLLPEDNENGKEDGEIHRQVEHVRQVDADEGEEGVGCMEVKGQEHGQEDVGEDGEEEDAESHLSEVEATARGI